MKKDEVPQDNSRTYAGHKRVVYAVNERGKYEKAHSSGWTFEEQATLMAVDELERLAAQAREKVSTGRSSPLEFHMYDKRYDVAGLAHATGLFQWQVRRHLKPAVFQRLPHGKLNRYAQALGLTAEQVTQLPQPEAGHE